MYAFDDEKGAVSSDHNNIHGCHKKRKTCKPDTRGTPLRKKNQSTVTTNTPKKQENNLVKRIKMLMVGRGWGDYASVGQEGGISVVDTRGRFKTRERVVNTGMPVRVKEKGKRARREEYILTEAGIKVPRTKNTGL